jgi:hypothetical protein
VLLGLLLLRVIVVLLLLVNLLLLQAKPLLLVLLLLLLLKPLLVLVSLVFDALRPMLFQSVHRLVVFGSLRKGILDVIQVLVVVVVVVVVVLKQLLQALPMTLGLIVLFALIVSMITPHLCGRFFVVMLFIEHAF